jgi:hypothetical protein
MCHVGCRRGTTGATTAHLVGLSVILSVLLRISFITETPAKRRNTPKEPPQAKLLECKPHLVSIGKRTIMKPHAKSASSRHGLTRHQRHSLSPEDV